MPARNIFSRWDLVWLLHPAGARGRNVRFVGRLGRKRPMWGRWFAGSRVVLVTVLVVIGIGAGSLSNSMRSLPPTGVGGTHIALALIYLACVAGILQLLGAGDEVRCVVSARERKRLARTPDRRAVAEELTIRRLRWEQLIKASTWWKVKLCLRSVAFRAAVLACFAAGMCFQTWRDNAALSLSRRTIANVLEVLYGGLIVVAIATGVWTWRRVKRTLEESLRGHGCPDCGYAITAGEVVKDARGVDIVIGPARCPECGCPWPLIPPRAIGTV